MARIDEIETRLSEIEKLIDTPDADLDALKAEVDSLTAERSGLIKAAELRNAVASGTGKVIKKMAEEINVVKHYDEASAEYRSAFYKALVNKEMTEEERNAMAEVAEKRGVAVGDGSALALPREVADEIYDAMEEQHALLSAIKLYRTGTILEIQQRTAITAGDAAETAENKAPAEEDNTLAKVVLYGKDFSKYVTLSYAAAKMSQGAFEDYLVSEISERMGAALVADIVKQIKTDCTNTAVKNSTPDYKALAGLLALVKGGTPKFVVSNATYYGKFLGMVDTNKQPVFRNGVNALADVIIDDAAGKDIIALVPEKFVGNMVQDIMVEEQRDIKAHSIVISGYARFQGTLALTTAAAVMEEADK